MRYGGGNVGAGKETITKAGVGQGSRKVRKEGGRQCESGQLPGAYARQGSRKVG